MKFFHLRWWSVLPAVLLAAFACSDVFVGVSGEPAPAAAKVDQLTTALAARFTNLDRGGRFDFVRRRLVNSAFTPGKLFGDTAVWSSITTPLTHTIYARGWLATNSYRFEVVPASVPTLTLGDTRHTIALTNLQSGSYRWETAVDLAVGSIGANDVASAFAAMWAAPEGKRDPEMRAVGQRLFPTTAAAMSRLFAIDSLDIAPGGQRTTVVYFRLALLPDRLRATYPHFADYVTKYSRRSTSSFVLGDAAGRRYLSMEGGHDRWIVRYRLLDGRMVAMTGAPVPMPDTLRLLADLTLRTTFFTIGFRSLVLDFFNDSSAHERGWTMLGHREPDWVLPLITEHLIGSSLRRPFQGTGAMFRLAVRDSAHGPTLLVRRGRLEVQESAMMRAINGIVSRMFDDLAPDVEREECAFVREVLVAFRRDAAALPHPK